VVSVVEEEVGRSHWQTLGDRAAGDAAGAEEGRKLIGRIITKDMASIIEF